MCYDDHAYCTDIGPCPLHGEQTRHESTCWCFTHRTPEQEGYAEDDICRYAEQQG